MIAGIARPFTPLAHWVGLVQVPPRYFAFLAFVTMSYLLVVEIVKRRIMGNA